MFDGVVLGIDPGLSRCGYGAVRREGSALRPVVAGVIRTPPSDPLPNRLAALEAELEAIVAEVRPTAMVVERVLFQVNVRTAMSVGQASGIALAVAARAGVPVTHYSPNEVKLAVVGYGAATKEQVQVMVTRLLSLPEILEPPDAADALALALCHASSAGLRAAVAVSAGAGTGAAGARGAGGTGRTGGGSSRLDDAVAAALARDRSAPADQAAPARGPFCSGGPVIGSVRGTVLDRTATGEVLVEVGGVGYRVLVPIGAYPLLTVGGPAFLFTHLHVRDDALVLYGFPSRDERDVFELLLAANGVGPKLALAILSVHTPSALQRALLDDDLDALTLVPGVGKRTAQRLLIELKNRLDLPDLDLTDHAASGAAAPARSEVRDALAGLGYAPDEVRATLAVLPDDGTVEELLREALRVLAGSR